MSKSKSKPKLTVKQQFNKFYKLIKKFFNFIFEKVKILLSNRYVRISLSVLLAVMFMLGFSMAWQCGDKGNYCSGGYKPPNPNDVNEIIRPGKK